MENRKKELTYRIQTKTGQILGESRQTALLSYLLEKKELYVFEYSSALDRMRIYDDQLRLEWEVENYLDFLAEDSHILSEDRWKILGFFEGNIRGNIEVQVKNNAGQVLKRRINTVWLDKEGPAAPVILGTVQDITDEKKQEELLIEQARRDSLTNLYNHHTGKELIQNYLNSKDPYASCGLMILDIDYFKSVNDTYGHLFGDAVLIELSRLLVMTCDKKDIVMRAGGDEFVILFKNIAHNVLVKKSVQLISSVRKLKFSEQDYSMTCSAGVCFLPENVSGYTYDQLFKNADWALYRAKEKGRNRYIFCDSLHRFESFQTENEETEPDIDARYLHNDIISTSFEIFEKNKSFDEAMRILLPVIGRRFQLDRITVIKTDVKAKQCEQICQWTGEQIPKVLESKGSFTKEDFLTLFREYDEDGTMVLQHDRMENYSLQARELLMQGDAKTVVYAAMYCEGTYIGAISYVTCAEKRIWSGRDRHRIGEVTKIISGHLAKKLTVNATQTGTLFRTEADSLTGLLSFCRFREETERIIVGRYAGSYVMVYSDFENFRQFNDKYGYSAGDRLLREFADHIISTMQEAENVYFTRVVADQFLLFMPCKRMPDTKERVAAINEAFSAAKREAYPEAPIRIRTGIYFVDKDCDSASAAIDAANAARRKITAESGDCGVAIYGEED